MTHYGDDEMLTAKHRYRLMLDVSLYAYTFEPVWIGDRWAPVRKLIHWRPGTVVMTKREADRACSHRAAPAAAPTSGLPTKKDVPRQPPADESDAENAARLAAYERLRAQ